MQEVIITTTRILSNQHIGLYNTELILSCLKQPLTPTLRLVTPIGIKTPEEANGVKEALAAKAAAITETAQLLNISLEGK